MERTNAERERRKLEEFEALPPVFHFGADGESFIGCKSTCPRCTGPLLLTLTLEQAAQLEYSDVTAEEVAKVIAAGMVAEQVICGRCLSVAAN